MAFARGGIIGQISWGNQGIFFYGCQAPGLYHRRVYRNSLDCVTSSSTRLSECCCVVYPASTFTYFTAQRARTWPLNVSYFVCTRNHPFQLPVSHFNLHLNCPLFVVCIGLKQLLKFFSFFSYLVCAHVCQLLCFPCIFHCLVYFFIALLVNMFCSYVSCRTRLPTLCAF